MSIIGTPLYLWVIWKNSDLFLRHQIQLSARTIDNIQIGSNRNINFACQYSRHIDDVQQVFDVTQACFQNNGCFHPLWITNPSCGWQFWWQKYFILPSKSPFWKLYQDLLGKTKNGTLHYDTSFAVSENKEVRTLTITPKHDIIGIFARSVKKIKSIGLRLVGKGS